ncbi:sensor histidine kinase [Spirillospora sp. NPDC050679]
MAEQRADHLSSRPVRGMLWASVAILFAIRALSGVGHGWWPHGVVLAALPYPPLIALLALRRGQAVRHGLLACLALLSLVPFLLVGWRWDWMPWPLAAGVLCTLSARWAWPLFGLLVIATGLVRAPAGDAPAALIIMIITADGGLIVFSIAALAATVERLAGTREELARLALARERLRLSGELRGVLGGKLQAIGFRLRKAAAADAHEARHDIGEATELARRTMAEVRATAAAYRVRPLPCRPASVRSPRLARRVMLAVLVIQCVLVLTDIAVSPNPRLDPLGPAKLAPVGLALAAIVALHLRPRTRSVLAAQAVLIVGPILFIGLAWTVLLSYFTAAVLLRVRPPFSWALVGLVLAGQLALLVRDGSGPLADDLAQLGGHLMLMWLLYSLERLTGLTVALEQARNDLADTAVRRERTRIARDLHDVLGYNLSAVALKGELAERLLDSAPERARAELVPLVAMVERAAAELEAIVVDRVELHLATEIGLARRMLEEAGIATTVRAEIPDALYGADPAPAAVLREAVTNILRHSRARTCEITLRESDGRLRLRVVNDGAEADEADEAARSARGGSGLANLAQRAGGRLTAGRRPGGRFEVVVEFRSDPVGLGRDPDGVDPVAGAQLGDR